MDITSLRPFNKQYRCTERHASCSLACVPPHRAGLVGWLPRGLLSSSDGPAAARRGPAVAAAPLYKSFDADDDLDKDLAEELSRFKSPEAWNSMAQHLDLVWKIGRNRGKRLVCACCQGSGQAECKWCNGTGAMMVGDTLFKGPDGSSHCPVCKGKGELACERCRGTGHLARWMQTTDSCSP